MMVFAWQRQRCDLTRIALALAGMFPLVALSGGLGAGTLWYIVLTLLLFSRCRRGQKPAGMEPKLKAVIVLAFLLCKHRHAFTTVWGVLGGKIKSDRGLEAGVASDARSTPEHPVLLDSWVARYIFDYKIPAGLLDIQFAAPFPKSHIVGQMRPGDIYLVGPENVDELLKESDVARPGRGRVDTVQPAPPLFLPLPVPGVHDSGGKLPRAASESSIQVTW